jgi:hypothetical protein
MPECDTTRPSEDPEALWSTAVDASEQAQGIRAIVAMLAQGCSDEDFEWQYCFQSLERLLAQLCVVLSDQLCAGLLRPAAAASEARKTVQP